MNVRLKWQSEIPVLGKIVLHWKGVEAELKKKSFLPKRFIAE